MIYTTFVARLTDGQILAESQSLAEEEQDINLKNAKVQVNFFLRTKARQFQKEDIPFKRLHFENANTNLKLNFKTNNGVIYMMISEEAFSFKLAKIYLDDIQNGFFEELKNKFGTQSVDYRSKIETIDQPYYFLTFGEKFLKKKRDEYRSLNPNDKMELLQKDLLQLSNIMKENIDLVLDRDNNLQQMMKNATSLKEDALTLKKKSQKLAWNYWLKKNMMFFIIIVLIILFVYFKFF